MKLTKISLAIVGGTAMAAAGLAQAAGPTLSDIFTNSGITESGYIDAAYTYLDAKNPTNAFDGSDYSTFNLKQAALTLAKQPSTGFGGLVNVTMGSDADIIKSYPYASGPGAASGFDLTQAFVQYVSGANTLQAGKFGTLASNEVIAPTGNTNITRSIEFFQVPFTHTGLRDTYAVSSTLSLIAGINNGWDQQEDANKDKTAELGFSWNPSATVSWATQLYYGPEVLAIDAGGMPTNASSSDRTLVDTVLTLKPTTALSLILNADYGQQKKASLTSPGSDASWDAIAGYLNYQFNDKWRTSIRLETFDDKDGYKLGLADHTTGAVNKRVSEATVTVGYAPDPAFELRAELRDDKADKDVYAKSDGSYSDTSLTAAVEGLYKF